MPGRAEADGAVTIFKTLGLSRDVVQWESHIDDQTPFQQGASGLWYKREDLWAPLGAGGINGFKVRQGVWLIRRALSGGRCAGLIFAGSVKSTQHAMVATVARHFGLPSVHVLGATTPETCIRQETVAIAVAMGAELDIIPVAYNPALQKRARELESQRCGYYRVEYGVGLEHTIFNTDAVEAYHSIGAAQVRDLPSGVTDIVIPAGSCHAATSVILGLSHAKHSATVHLVGLGPYRGEWLTRRLGILGLTLLLDEHRSGSVTGPSWRTRVVYYDLIGQGYVSYQDRWPETFDGIEFHPTYEAKIVRWLRERAQSLVSPSTLMWVVGSEPKLEAMAKWVSAHA